MALIGSNGAGKSTLMKMMVGLLKPQQGTVSLFGESLAGKQAGGSVHFSTAVVYWGKTRRDDP